MKAYIFDRVYIPGLGMGPFYTPIEVPDVRMIKTISAISSNYKFIFDEDKDETPVVPPIIENLPEVIPPVVEEEKQEEVIPPVVEEEKQEEVIPPVVEDVIEETVVEEEVKTLTEEELKELTVEELKDLLDANEIEYLYKDKKTTLINKYLTNVK